MTTKQYAYRPKAIEKVTDGDTFWLHLDVGFRGSLLVCIRLDGYDCPELHSTSQAERDAALRAKEVTAKFLTDNLQTIWVQTEKDPDNFGRWLGDVYSEVGETVTALGDVLKEQGLATVWPTRWHEQYGGA